MADQQGDQVVPKLRLRISTSATFESVLRADSFVDRTLLLPALFAFDHVPKILATAPHLFGKSVNLDMVHRFLELEVDGSGREKPVDEKSNYKLFRAKELNIMKAEHHDFVNTYFGMYPLIRVNFMCSFVISHLGDAVKFFKKVVHEAFEQHRYLYKSEESPLEDYEKEICRKWCTYPDYKTFDSDDVLDGLKLLSKFLKTFFGKKIFVLIDEYDSVILEIISVYDIKDIESHKIVAFWTKMIGNVMVANDDNIAGGLVTGIMDLNSNCTVLDHLTKLRFGEKHSFSDFYGFTEREVQTLFQKFSVGEELQKEALHLYGGYSAGTCSSYSVIKFLLDPIVRNDWQPSGIVEQHLAVLLSSDEVRDMVEKLLNDNPIGVSTNAVLVSDLLRLCKDDHDSKSKAASTQTCMPGSSTLKKSNASSKFVAALLLCQGCLTYNSTPKHGETAQLIIPNAKVREFLRTKLLNYFPSYVDAESLQTARRCSELLKNLTTYVDEAENKIRDVLQMMLNNLTNFVTHAHYKYPHLLEFQRPYVKAGLTMTAAEADFFWHDGTPRDGTDLFFKMFTRVKCLARSSRPSISFLLGVNFSFSRKTASLYCIRNKTTLDVLGDIKTEDLCVEDRLHKALCAKAKEYAEHSCDQLNTHVIKASCVLKERPY